VAPTPGKDVVSAGWWWKANSRNGSEEHQDHANAHAGQRMGLLEPIRPGPPPGLTKITTIQISNLAVRCAEGEGVPPQFVGLVVSMAEHGDRSAKRRWRPLIAQVNNSFGSAPIGLDRRIGWSWCGSRPPAAASSAFWPLPEAAVRCRFKRAAPGWRPCLQPAAVVEHQHPITGPPLPRAWWLTIRIVRALSRIELRIAAAVLLSTASPGASSSTAAGRPPSGPRPRAARCRWPPLR